MKPKLEQPEIITCESLPHDEVLTTDEFVGKAIDLAQAEERERIISLIKKEIQPLKVSENMELREGYNQALNQIINLLDNK